MKTKDTPLSEVTFRRYEKPYDLKGRELVRKLCLSTGLLQPGDSRDVIIDIFLVLLEAMKKEKALSSEDVKKKVEEKRAQLKLPMLGIASSNIRRQLKRLRGLFFIEKVKNKYRITEFSNLEETFDEKVDKFLLPSIIKRVKEYVKAVNDEFTS
ncbi:hypothetical protein HQ529_06285 [Candidatus Woesearchaeota archaeon]|nr:hypothetical protein [Candidatus Woesearchaeota archaeon]